MTIKIRNKNKYVYGIRSKVRRFLRRSNFMQKNYLKLKEIVIKNNFRVPADKNKLFDKVFIETVSYCNNDCAFCPASAKAGAKNPKNLMLESLYLKILNELANLSFIGSIAFHCNNEPLLDARLSSRIRIARGLLKNNFFYLYTNGILINANLVNELFESGLNRIIINNYNDQHKLNPSIRKLLNNSAVLGGEVIINYRAKTDYFGNRAGQSPNAGVFLKNPLKIQCLRPLTEIVIGYDGTVPLCCADGLWKVVMGDAKDSTLKDIWFSDFFKSARRSLAKGSRSCSEICKVCDALNFPAPKGIRE
ncbi:MAG: SPASM domain-containing protein [Candidatus Omnitrophica bacterium]|nr:SPASM domain-containing protein [Candidatus Omnitrophota bacterium]